MYYTKAILFGLTVGFYYGQKSIPAPVTYYSSEYIRKSWSKHKRDNDDFFGVFEFDLQAINCIIKDLSDGVAKLMSLTKQ